MVYIAPSNEYQLLLHDQIADRLEESEQEKADASQSNAGVCYYKPYNFISRLHNWEW